jgi:hypothetical protein
LLHQLLKEKRITLTKLTVGESGWSVSCIEFREHIH